MKASPVESPSSSGSGAGEARPKFVEGLEPEYIPSPVAPKSKSRQLWLLITFCRINLILYMLVIKTDRYITADKHTDGHSLGTVAGCRFLSLQQHTGYRHLTLVEYRPLPSSHHVNTEIVFSESRGKKKKNKIKMIKLLESQIEALEQ